MEEPQVLSFKERDKNEELNDFEGNQINEINTQKITLSKDTNEHKISALSLKSIKKKRELEASLNPIQINQDDLPKDLFTFEELKKHWNFCSNQYYSTGRMLMSSTMNMAQLNLNSEILTVEFPNTGSKLTFEENLYDLVSYIHKKLNNYHLKFNIVVNEKVELKKLYSPNDKLEYLKEVNPTLDLLIKTFNLETKQ